MFTRHAPHFRWSWLSEYSWTIWRDSWQSPRTKTRRAISTHTGTDTLHIVLCKKWLFFLSLFFMSNIACLYKNQIKQLSSKYIFFLRCMGSFHVRMRLKPQHNYYVSPSRCGDFKKLVSSTSFLPLPPLDNITMTSPTLTPNETAVLHSVEDYLWNQMVLRRNRRMANSIHSLLSNTRNKTYFVALGAGKSVDFKLKNFGSIFVYVRNLFVVATVDCADLRYVCVYKACHGKASL